MAFQPTWLYFFWLIYRLASWTSTLEIFPGPSLLLLCPASLQIQRYGLEKPPNQVKKQWLVQELSNCSTIPQWSNGL